MKRFIFFILFFCFSILFCFSQNEIEGPELLNVIQLEIHKIDNCAEIFLEKINEKNEKISICNEILLNNEDVRSIKLINAPYYPGKYSLLIFCKDINKLNVISSKYGEWAIYFNGQYYYTIGVGVEMTTGVFPINIGDAKQTEKIIGKELFKEYKKILNKE